MAMSRLPGDGELELGPVRLPAGKRVRAGYGSGEPVAWITLDKVPEAGRVWAALSRAHLETGLIPFLASGLDKSTERPWNQEEFTDPADVTGLGDMDAAVLLQEWWDGSTSEAEEGEEYEEDPDFTEYIEGAIALFSRQFPGLPPALHESLTPEQMGKALGSRAARIGLAPAARPADVLPQTRARRLSPERGAN